VRGRPVAYAQAALWRQDVYNLKMRGVEIKIETDNISGSAGQAAKLQEEWDRRKVKSTFPASRFEISASINKLQVGTRTLSKRNNASEKGATQLERVVPVWGRERGD